MSRKVCHITSAHSRYSTRILLKQCKSLAMNGYDVYLLVNDDKDNEIIDGVKIISIRNKDRNRLDRFLKVNKKLFNKAIEIDADIYQLHDPDLLPLGNKLKKRGKKIIFDSHENVPMQIKDKQWIPKPIRNIVSWAYEFYEKYSIKKYDAVISVTPNTAKRLKKTNPNTVIITNYPIVNKNENIVRNPTKAICFAGGINEQYKHHNILEAIEEIDDIKYILAGNGTSEYLNMLQSLSAWDKVEYKGWVPHTEVKKIYSRSIAGMAIHQSTQIMARGTLGVIKLFEFMEAKLPIICSDYPLWKDIVNQYNCGICVDPNDVEEIKSAINYIIENPEEAKKMGENGRKAVIEKYNWGTQEKVLLELYENL